MKSRFLLALIIASSGAVASERSTVTFSLDNDGIFGVDEDYTNGLFLSYTSGAINTPWILTPLSLSAWGATSLDKFEFTLGHKMWTPSDIEDAQPIANDRPYAGYFHGEFNFISLHPQQAQRFNLTIGTVGENSFASQAQKLVHSITGSDDPNGWEYQVDEGMVGSVGYLSHFNLGRHNSFGNTELEFSNISEGNIGGFRSDLSTGLMLRWGTDLGGNMGAANISTENPVKPGMIGASNSAWFVFTGIEGRYRFNDITIEGDRPNIENQEQYPATLENWQSSAVFGAVWYNQYLGASLTFTAKTPDYKESPSSVYGTGGLTLFTFF
ncbi:lipid A deacylase LpxR family protein [Vibrio sp. ZSDE26]|uniref:Lipid A deacylase LpxR family protein n=1 Tax=Vibrio amylolyticus TaxID=2847292 RepID=A0A9X1XNN3_9VIBR|nr:lipid A deacylase LpxR family protein [Vibrio amylolyticus]MCK6262824.1 lipid A deacylase LpxR family protein [Vibrio amylolyticus]